MGFFKAILLGIIQGLAEFLPISSSGHLKLAQYFLHTEEAAGSEFDIFLHLGTLVAVLIYFRKEIWALCISLFKLKNNLDNQVHYHNRLWILYLGLSTATTLVFYLVFQDWLDKLFDKPNPLIIALMLSITGLIVFISDKVKNCRIPAFSMGFIRSVIIGLGQGIAIIPGISRSGTTIAVSLFCGIKRKDAARYSFLLSTPAILGANLKELSSFKELQSSELAIYLAGFVSAAVVGYAVISLLISFIQNSKLKYFSYYCWALALVTVLIVAI